MLPLINPLVLNPAQLFRELQKPAKPGTLFASDAWVVKSPKLESLPWQKEYPGAVASATQPATGTSGGRGGGGSGGGSGDEDCMLFNTTKTTSNNIIIDAMAILFMLYYPTKKIFVINLCLTSTTANWFINLQFRRVRRS